MMGEKSGVEGIYPAPESAGLMEEMAHFPECCIGYFDPEFHPQLFDEKMDEFREAAYNETVDEIRDEYLAKFAQVTEAMAGGYSLGDLPICGCCLEDMEEEEEEEVEDINCLWCKAPDQVWIKVHQGHYFYRCFRCNKGWNEDEEET